MGYISRSSFVRILDLYFCSNLCKSGGESAEGRIKWCSLFEY